MVYSMLKLYDIITRYVNYILPCAYNKNIIYSYILISVYYYYSIYYLF